MAFDNLSTEELEQITFRAQAEEVAMRAREGNMLDFMKFMWPDEIDPYDVEKSEFVETPLAKLLCEVIEKVDRGELKRVCVSVGPQFGKSQVLSRGAPAFLSGRKPSRKMILGSYNDTFAAEFGEEVREILNSERFKLVFPEYKLMRGSEAKNLLKTTKRGKMSFVGVGGSATGKAADIFFIDDPFKNDEDAQSETYREKVWKWLSGVAFARGHKDTAIVIVHTRWNEDDLIGRLCDPDHPERNKKYKGIAERWTYYNLPAVVETPQLANALGLELQKPTDPIVIEQFGNKPIVSLWEDRKSIQLLAEAKQMDSRVFEALYMGHPSPEEGTYFLEENLIEYQPEELPKNLRYYGASDHGASEKQSADPSVLGCVGVDEDDIIWVLPDVVWERMETDRTVEELIVQMRTHKPGLWWLESELISKSFGPFLKRRMIEEQIYQTTLDPQRPSKDKVLRARSIQGRISMKRVRFPASAPWWPAAKRQMLVFPYGANDDFVDWLAWIGLGLLKEHGAESTGTSNSNVVKTGTLEWIRQSSDARERQDRIKKAAAGW